MNCTLRLEYTATNKAHDDDQSRNEHCEAFGLELAGGIDVRDVRLKHADRRAAVGSTSAARLAVCVTGQLRGFPLSFMNWRHSILRLLRVGGLTIDFFFVLSNSSSFGY